METIKTTVYNFDELSDTAKDRAREWWREASQHDEWWEYTYEDAKTIGALMGIEIENIYFSGFSCQGDGALFEGYYSYRKESVKAVKGHIGTSPADLELIRIAEELSKFQRRFFYTVEATVKQSSHHYSHKYCTTIDGADQHGDLNHEDDEELAVILRDFMEWIYRQLESEHDYQNADEQVDENIKANEYTFTEEGARFG